MIQERFFRHRKCLDLIRRNLTKAAEIKEAKPYSELPQVTSVPILRAGWNYLPFIGKYKLSALHHAAESKLKTYGPIVREDLNSTLRVVHLFEVEDFEKVYRNEGQYPSRRAFECMKRYRDQRPDLYANAGLLLSNGEEWYDVRSHVQPHMLKPKAIHTYLHAMDRVAMELVDRTALLRQENGGEVRDYLSELYKWALESVGIVALDTHLGCLQLKPSDESAQMIRMVGEMFEQVLRLEFSPVKVWKVFNTPLLKSFTKNMDDFSRSAQKYMLLAKDRLKSIPEDHEATFLEMLITTSKDPRHVTTMITDMFFAGIDTTSTAVGFTLYHLARNPECQEKAYQEVKSILQREGMTTEALNQAKYLKACVKESMRLTPVVVATARTMPEEIVLCGYRLPAGTVVVMQNYVAGRLEKNFTDPLVFRPERFLREQRLHDPFAFVPFGFGPRSCIGRRIAEQEIWTLLIRLLERFRIEHKDGDIEFFTRIVTCPTKPLNFQFFDR